MKLYLALALAAFAPACSSSYGKPSSSPPSESYSRDDDGEQRLVIDRLVEFGKSFPLRYRPKGTGQLAISSATITWTNDDDDDRSFSLRPEVIRSVTMQCVERAGGNICLEIVLETFTGLSYRFRDIEWAGGYNDRVRHVHDHLKDTFPRILFAENTVDDIG
jgi:hypothetical protein